MPRLHRRYRKKKRTGESTPRKNPPLLMDLVEFVGPGFAAFAVTRFGTRIAATQIAKRKPSWGKHAGALASISAFLAAWFLGHRVKLLARYHTPIAVGAAIAAAQSLIQLYIPKLGWIVSDASPEIAAASADNATTRESLSGSPQRQLPAELEFIDDDPSLYTYNDSYDAGRYTTGKMNTAQAAQRPPPSSTSSDEMMLDIDLDAGEAQTMGIFGGD